MNSISANSIQDLKYMVCALDKSVESGGGTQEKKRFSFRVVNSSGWVAVGLCHQKAVGLTGYQLDLQAVGHGAYLLSSNGGSWSNFDASFNNVVRGFKFASGDQIECTVEFMGAINLLRFRKGVEEFELEFRTVEGDPLFPCAVLYYMND